MWWIISAVIAAVACAIVMALPEIMEWIESHRNCESRYAELIKKRLSSGNYRVVAGVFDRRGTCQISHSWECDELDSSLDRRFGSRDNVRISF